MKKKLILTIVAFTVLLLSGFIHGAIPAAERSALIALYNSTNGDDWDSRNGWKTPPLHTDGFAMPGTEGNWDGVILDGDHVTRLVLWDHQLKGSIPLELGNLSYLQGLWLELNQLSGSIPPELGNLSNLASLHLDDNQLSGSIPSELGNLENLQSFDLCHNQLSGGIPIQLSNLGKMKEFYLSSNQLSGSIPPEFGNLSNLTHLDLSENQLSGCIPSEIGNLKKLAGIHLEYNQLNGNIPSELGDLSNLLYLNLSDNQLSGSIPSKLGNLSNLQTLALSNNQLSGAIPSQLGNLSQVKYFYLQDNQLSDSIPPELGNLSNLLSLYLDDNQLSGGIPSELGNLENLDALYLEYNQLSGSIPSQLGNLSKLGFLHLNNNRLSGNIPSQLGNLSLIELSLSVNQLSGEIPTTFMNFKNMFGLNLSYNCLSATDPALIAWLNIHAEGWENNQDECSTPEIALNRTALNFGAYYSEVDISPQTVQISNKGTGTLNWSASGNAAWLSVTHSSGTGDSVLSVSVDPSGLAVGDYTGEISITDSRASNSPQTITVLLHVYNQGQTAAPFGEFATPLDGAAVSGSIPVTGWALDDIEVASVKIYNGDAYTGHAVLVEGARPDVEAAYPTYPHNYKAGWGYMLLTNCLPDGGNGTYTLIAKAIDLEGNEVTLGSKTITVDNAHAVKPFGAIDTPFQGGTASGNKFVNNGWALTPQPNSIPMDGSTINVIIDGVVKGHPIYNVYRWDIAWYFPGNANSGGAAGYYYLDTTKLSNGIHTIAWTVSDSEGNSDGIGSRYFTVQNLASSVVHEKENNQNARKTIKSFDQTFSKGGWQPQPIKAGSLNGCEGDIDYIEIKELERVEINLSDEEVFEGYLEVGDQLRELPIGSTFDRERGIFYWQPGPGFVGEYRLVFIGKDGQGQHTRKNIVVNIKPKQ